MASCASRMPSSKVASWLMSVATSSVGLISPPLISEKCVARLPKACPGQLVGVLHDARR